MSSAFFAFFIKIILDFSANTCIIRTENNKIGNKDE